MFLFPIKFLVSLGMCSILNCQNKECHYLMHTKQSKKYQNPHIHQDLLHMLHFLFFRQIISRINFIKSRSILIILFYSIFVKGWGEIKNS